MREQPKGRDMNRRLKRTVIAGLLTTALSCLLASSAAASFHLTKIREVHRGVDAAHSWVMLQLPEDNEGFLMNHYVSFRSEDGQIGGDHLITTNTGFNLSQRTYLVGGLRELPPAHSPGAVINWSTRRWHWIGLRAAVLQPGGLDCVTWGAFNGMTTPLSSPAGQSGTGTRSCGQSLVRTIARGCATDA